MERLEQVLGPDPSMVRQVPRAAIRTTSSLVALPPRWRCRLTCGRPSVQEAGRDIGLPKTHPSGPHRDLAGELRGGPHELPTDERADRVEVPGQDREVGAGARRCEKAKTGPKMGKQGRRRGEGRLDTTSSGRGQVPQVGVEAPGSAPAVGAVGQLMAFAVDGHLALGHPVHKGGISRAAIASGDDPEPAPGCGSARRWSSTPVDADRCH